VLKYTRFLRALLARSLPDRAHRRPVPIEHAANGGVLHVARWRSIAGEARAGSPRDGERGYEYFRTIQSDPFVDQLVWNKHETPDIGCRFGRGACWHEGR
jgi:hypothetical protein